MIIIRLIGGLGNQLFQIQYAKNIALGGDSKIKIDDSFLKQSNKAHEVLGIPDIESSFERLTLSFFTLKIIRPFEKFLLKTKLHKYFKYRKFFFESENISGIKKNFILDGFWQDKRWINQNFIDSIRRIIDKNNKTIKISSRENVICMHIRRGDYLTNKRWFRLQQHVLDISYYERAIEYFLKLSPLNKFHIFTDDENWAKLNFKNDRFEIINSKNLTPFDLLSKMSLYKDFIIANSTLSWWAAVLSKSINKTVVLPMLWGKSVDSDRYALDGWIKL